MMRHDETHLGSGGNASRPASGHGRRMKYGAPEDREDRASRAKAGVEQWSDAARIGGSLGAAWRAAGALDDA
jgi:hypothetical protein